MAKEKRTYTLIIRELNLEEARELAENYGGGMIWSTLQNGDKVSYPCNLPCEITNEEVKTRNSKWI